MIMHVEKTKGYTEPRILDAGFSGDRSLVAVSLCVVSLSRLRANAAALKKEKAKVRNAIEFINNKSVQAKAQDAKSGIVKMTRESVRDITFNRFELKSHRNKICLSTIP